MNEECKELLLKDLSSRLPYGVQGYVNDRIVTLQGVNVMDSIVEYDIYCSVDVYEFTPYLFPLSSMTKMQRDEYISTCDYQNTYDINNEWIPTLITFDWCNKNHFDYRGLIPMGLAKDATGLNIY